MMELDPHTLQQILQRIYQQMRCPQCGKKVPVEFNSIQLVSDSAMLLQLKCEGCNAYIVLQASLQGIEHLSAPPYQERSTANASSGLEMSRGDMDAVKKALANMDGNFSDYFKVKAEVGEEE